jgi:hypothetical protein
LHSSLHWRIVPPPQRQHAWHDPVRSHVQHTGVSLQGHTGHEVVTPLQVTLPGVLGQLGFTATQLVLALEQVLVVLSRQVTVAVQVFSFWTTEARFIEATCVAQEAPARGSPRIADRTSSETGPGAGPSAKPATEMRRRVQAKIQVLFMIFLLSRN